MKILSFLLFLTVLLGVSAIYIRVPKEQKRLSNKEYAEFCDKQGMKYLGMRVKAHQTKVCKG